MNKKISLNITKIIMLLTLMIESSSVVYAEDANKIKKCSMMSGIVANIVDDLILA